MNRQTMPPQRPTGARFIILAIIFMVTSPLLIFLSYLPFSIFNSTVVLIAFGAGLVAFPLAIVGVLILTLIAYTSYDTISQWRTYRCVWVSSIAGIIIGAIGMAAFDLVDNQGQGLQLGAISGGLFGIPPAITITLLFRYFLLRQSRA